MSDPTVQTATDQIEVRKIPCDLIDDPESFRDDLGDVPGLAASIEELGLLQPIVVAPREARYSILAGRRRLAAFCLLERSEILAVVNPVDSDRAIEIQCAENAQRKRLSPMEAVRIARRLRPLMREAAQKRARAGKGEVGDVRELLAKRV